jgi:hypothetical protein
VLSVAVTVVLSVPVVAVLVAVTVNVTGALVVPGARLLIVYELSTEGVVKLPVLPVSVGIASVKLEAVHWAVSLFVTLTVYCAVPPLVVILFVAGVTLMLCAARVQEEVILIVVATALDVTVPC